MLVSFIKRRTVRGGRALTNTSITPAACKRLNTASVLSEIVLSERSSVPSRSVATRRKLESEEWIVLAWLLSIAAPFFLSSLPHPPELIPLYRRLMSSILSAKEEHRARH